MKSVTLIDCCSLNGALKAIRNRTGNNILRIDYTALFKALENLRKTWQWAPSKFTQILVPKDSYPSEGFDKFVNMLRKIGYLVYVVDTVEAIRSASVCSSTFQTPSMSARMAYTMGEIAANQDMQLMVVSHEFEMWYPLYRASSRLSKVGLAYFGSLLDYRWAGHGLFEDQMPTIHFMELDCYKKKIFGTDL